MKLKAFSKLNALLLIAVILFTAIALVVFYLNGDLNHQKSISAIYTNQVELLGNPDSTPVTIKEYISGKLTQVTVDGNLNLQETDYNPDQENDLVRGISLEIESENGETKTYPIDTRKEINIETTVHECTQECKSFNDYLNETSDGRFSPGFTYKAITVFNALVSDEINMLNTYEIKNDLVELTSRKIFLTRHAQ